MLYRLFALRRLILACALPVAFAAWAVGMGPLYAGTLALIGFALLLVLSPGSYLEALAMSLATCVTLPVLALANAFIRPDGFVPGASANMLYGAIGLGWFFAMLGFVKLICWTDCLPRGEILLRSRTLVPLPVDQAMEALCVQPEKKMANRTCWPADDAGIFWVTFGTQGVDSKNFNPEWQEHSYQSRVIEETEEDGAKVHVAQTYLDLNGRESSAVVRLKFHAKGDKTLVISEEVSDHLSWLASITFWLRDYGADHMKSEIDGFLGQDRQSLAYRANTGVLVVLARFFVRTGLVDEPGDRL